jgi:hypothetical protein
MTIADAVFISNAKDDIEPTHLENIICLTIAGCDVVDAIEYVTTLNESQYELFKKIVALVKNDHYLYSYYECIIDKSQIYIDCYEYLLNSMDFSLENMQRISLFTQKQCIQMLRFVRNNILITQIGNT